MRQKIKKELFRQITAVFLIVCMLAGLGMPGMPEGVLESYAAGSAVADAAFVHGDSPGTNYAGNSALIIGKRRHLYVKLNVSAVSLDAGAKAILSADYSKGGATYAFIVNECSNYLRDGEKDSTTLWDKTNINYNNRPLDLADGVTVTTESANQNGKPLALDVTDFVKKAKEKNQDMISLHILTDQVDTELAAVEYKKDTLDLVVNEGEEEEPEKNYVTDDTYVRFETEAQKDQNFGKNATMVIGKYRFAYIRIDISELPSAIKKAELKLQQVGGSAGTNNFQIYSCGEFLSNGTTKWTEDTVTYNNRPDVLSEELIATAKDANGYLTVDITNYLQTAKSEGKTEVSLRITTDNVDQAGSAGTDFASLTPANGKIPPHLEVEENDTEIFSPVEAAQKGDNYWEGGRISQKVFKIKGEDDKFLALREDGGFKTTEVDTEAAVFSLYVFDYAEYAGYQGDYQKTTYAIKCLDNGKYLTIQNYFAEDDLKKNYYLDYSDGMEIRADADAVNWNERFFVAQSTTRDAIYTIKSHLGALRDPAPGEVFVRMGKRLYAAGSRTKTYKFTFVDVTDKTDEAKQPESRSFNHPGIMHSQDELKAMSEHIQAKEEPWYSDYLKLRDTVPDNMANENFTVKAHAGVGRGTPAGSGNIDDFEQSGNAAYFNALQWVVTGEDKYADKAKEVLNTWANELKVVDGRDRILGAAINSCRFINAAEILRYYDGGYSGYTDADFKKFQDMAMNVIYPVVEDLGLPMVANGNWDTAALISMISIGVVCDNADIYNRAVSLYNDIHVNGSIDVYVSDWGQSVESGRDQAHAQLGIGYMADICMVDKHQGGNLYSLYDNRLAKAFNWAAQYNLYESENDDTWHFEPIKGVFGRTDGSSYWTSMDAQQINRGELRPIYEVPLALYDGTGVDMTWTEKAAQAMRAQGYVHNDNLNFGTMTAYSGEVQDEACQPYFQIRTRLEPWYQRDKGAVNKYGTPDEDSPYETLNSYFNISETGELVASSKKISAPYFQLVRNDDDTCSIQCVRTKRYLSVKDEKVGDANVIKADAETIGENEKFNYKATGAARYFLSSPAYENRVVYIYEENTTSDPKNAVLTMRLGPNKESSISALKNNEILNIYYNTKEAAETSSSSALTGIEILTPPSRTLYKTGEELDTTGLSVLAKGKNGTESLLNEGEYSLSAYDSSKEGRQTVTVSVDDPENDTVHKSSFMVEFDDNYIGRIQAEDFTEKAGNIYIRDNKEPVPGTNGDLILDGADQGKFVDFSNPVADTSHYTKGMTGGDMATWKINVPREGFYKIAFRYNNPGTKWNGHRNARDERNCRIVINNDGDYLQATDNWVGWMIFNVSGYNSSSHDQSTVQSPDTIGGNTRWNSNYMNVRLDAGENNLTLGIEAPPGQAVYDGPNLDCFDIIYIGDEYVDDTEIPYLPDDFKFTHPGTYYTMEDLVNMKAQKDEEGTVYNEGFKQLSTSKYAQKDYTPDPSYILNVGPYNNPDENKGGVKYTNDMMAAHHNALMWYFTDDKEHAAKAIEILNAWTKELKEVKSSNDIKLRVALMGVEMINAAEILKNIYNQAPDVTEEEKWQQEDIEAFETFLKDMIIPNATFYPQANGNWDALIGAFNMAAAVYLDDVDMFNMCLRQFYIGDYCKGNTASMGSLPNYIYPTGEAQETSRDQTHVQMGLTGLSHQCNIAWNQGLDLFTAYDNRLLKGVLYHGKYNMGEDVDSDTFASDKGRGVSAACFEIVYQHYKKYGDGISQEDLNELETIVEAISRGEGKHIKNEVKENWEWYLAMIFARDEHSDIERPAKLTIAQEPTKKVYTLGEELDVSGIKIVLTKGDGTQVTLKPEDCTIDELDSSKAGEQEIFVRYTYKNGDTKKELKASFTVEVKDESYYTTDIEVTKKPNKMTYYVGEEFDPKGMQITASQKASGSNATRKISVDPEKDSKKLSYDYDFDEPKKNAEVEIIYTDKDKDGGESEFTTTLKVKVEEEPVDEVWYTDHIRIASKPKKLLYQVGEEFDPEGIKVVAVRKSSVSDNKKEETLSLDEVYFDYDFSEAGEKTVTVMYDGMDKKEEEKTFKTNLKVTVANAAEDGFYTDKIAITKQPDKLSYNTGDSFDRTGMEVTLYQVNKETEEAVEKVITDYQVSPSVLMKAGSCTVTVSYASTDKDGKAKVFKDSLEVTVKEKSSSSGGRGSRYHKVGSVNNGTSSFKDAKKGMMNTVLGIVTGSGAGYSNWVLDGEKGAWKLQYADNSFATGSYFIDSDGTQKEQVAWEMVNGSWYAFGADGYAKGGFVTDYQLGGFFYIDIERGMLTGWQMIDGKWYYFNTVSDGNKGMMLANQTTPDGFIVGADGSWIP